jgi:NADP-dependent 3-hydroxy acid dehydrogenase YdfG
MKIFSVYLIFDELIGQPLEVVADLTKSDELSTLVNQTIKTFGKLDILVNNAGIYPNTDIYDKNLMQTWDQIFNIDLRAVVELIHQTVPYLEQTNGTIIDTSSVLGIVPVRQLLILIAIKLF